MSVGTMLAGARLLLLLTSTDLLDYWWQILPGAAVFFPWPDADSCPADRSRPGRGQPFSEFDRLGHEQRDVHRNSAGGGLAQTTFREHFR